MGSLQACPALFNELEQRDRQRWSSWLQTVDRPAATISAGFEVDFNLEYWSCRLFGGDSRAARKLHEIRGELTEKVLGRIEVGSYAGMNLEPFDRLVMLALIQLWTDQGSDPEGRLAFSYRELFRRLGLKAGGRQTKQIKSALDRLRRCFITLTNCFVTRAEDGAVVPVEAEQDSFTLLKLKQTATIGSGEDAQRLVVCQLSSIVLSGLIAPGHLRPRIASGVLRRLRAKNSIAILLHGFYNGRLRLDEQQFFEYRALGDELGISEQYHSNLVNRLLAPHQKLEEFGAIQISEASADRRGRGLTVTLLAGIEPESSLPIVEAEPRRVAIEKKDKDQLPLFEQTPTAYDEQLLLAFRAAGVKNIRTLLRRYGKNMPEREIWALLESVRGKNEDERWTWRRGPDAYVAKCLHEGFYVAEDYLTPKERLAEQQGQERALAEERRRREAERAEALAALEETEQGLDRATRSRLEDAAVQRLLASSRGFSKVVKRLDRIPPIAPVEERYRGLGNSVVREAYDRCYQELVLEHQRRIA